MIFDLKWSKNGHKNDKIYLKRDFNYRFAVNHVNFIIRR